MKKYILFLLLLLSTNLYADSIATFSWNQNPQVYEPVCDSGGVAVTSGSKIVIGDTNFPPTPPFTNAIINKEFVVSGAGLSGSTFYTKVASVESATSLTMVDPAQTTVVNAGYGVNISNDIKGYKIHWGQVSGGPYPAEKDVNYVTTYTTPAFPDGTYYFVVSAYDACGNVSGYSNQVSKVFGSVTPPGLSFNFTASPGVAVTNYTNDFGSTFNTTTGFGWTGFVDSRTRNHAGVDPRLDSFVFTTTPVTWNVVVPNGNYLVTLASGDADWPQGPHRVDVEGLRAINDISTTPNQFITVTDFPVNVLDGKLTITIGGSAGNTMLNYVVIKSTTGSLLPAPGGFTVK